MNTQKVALVTGATRGLGKELADQLSKNNFLVYMGVRNLAKGREVWQNLPQNNNVRLIFIDMNNSYTFRPIYEQIEAEHGKLDLLINNAGVMLDGDLMTDSTTTVPAGTLKQTFETNFFSVVQLTNLLLPLLAKSDNAQVINISSDMGSLHLHAGKKIPVRTFAYNASKAALNAYTIHLANALEKQNIRVNAVHPGWVKTDMGGEMAPFTAAEACQPIVQLAKSPAQGPNGKFLFKENEVNW